MSLRVKICGITKPEDALIAVKYDADALGFVFYESSPRYITPQDAKELITQLPPFISTVGLFVNETPQRINQIVKECKLDYSQIHFEMSDEDFSKLDHKAIRVVRAKEPSDVLKYSNEYRIVDAYTEEFGGSGLKVNLDWFDDVDCSKIILAGGLSPYRLKGYGFEDFYGLDVSSGVESSKGVKSHIRMVEFIANAKSL